MIKEAIDTIAELAVDANATEVITPEGEPKHYYGIRVNNGEVEWREAKPQPRAHIAMDLTAIVAFALRFHNPPDFPCAVWYSRKEVKCIINENERRDMVTLNLLPSVPLAKLMMLEANPGAIPQAAAVLMLRTTFSGCIDPAFINVIRRLKFRTTDAGSGVVEHGRASIGQEALESEITGEGVVPEYVTFDVPVFSAGFQATAPVRCAVEPIPGQGAEIQIIPLPGQIESAFAFGEDRIEAVLTGDLAEKEVPVLYGRVV